MEKEIYTGPKLVSTTGNPGIMVAGCIVPVNPANLEYDFYSPYMNPDYVFSMELITSGNTKGPSLYIQFQNVKNRNDYIFLMQCTPYLATGSVDNEHYLACSYYARGIGEIAVQYEFYMYDTNNGANIKTDSYYTFFLPCIE